MHELYECLNTLLFNQPLCATISMAKYYLNVNVKIFLKFLILPRKASLLLVKYNQLNYYQKLVFSTIWHHESQIKTRIIKYPNHMSDHKLFSFDLVTEGHKYLLNLSTDDTHSRIVSTQSSTRHFCRLVNDLIWTYFKLCQESMGAVYLCIWGCYLPLK